MPRRSFLVALVFALACSHAAAPSVATPPRAAPPARPQVDRSPPPDATYVRACEPSSAALQSATQDVEAVAAKIAALGDTDDPTSVWNDLERLLDGECFALHPFVRMYSHDAAPTSGLSLRTWWDDGGEEWVGQFLDPQITWQRPSVRRVLAPELVPDHALVDMLCPLANLDCAPQTRGWRLRAVAAFETFARHRRTTMYGGDDDMRAPADWGQCRDRAETRPYAERYQSWTACIDDVVLRQPVFPIGGLRAPTTGWLVVRGRRGHHSFCDEVRALHVGTGSVHVAQSCSRLAMRDDGDVDGGTTNANRTLTTYSGTMPVDAVREAVWMLLWSTEVPPEQIVGGVGHPLSDMIDPVAPADVFPIGDLGSISASGRTTLSWTWMRDGHAPVHGTLRWSRDDNNGAAAHAAELLEVAEAAMEPGCAARGVPRLVWPGKRVASADETQRELEDALAGMRPKLCRAR